MTTKNEELNKNLNLTDPYEIARFIKESQKSTPVKAYIKGTFDEMDFKGVKNFGEGNFRIVLGEYAEVLNIIETNKDSKEE